MPMMYEKVVGITNEIIDKLNLSELTQNETVAVLGQLLIYTGASLSDQEINFEKMDWNKLEKLYYINDNENDIGLGVMLNGGAIMQAIDDEFITSNVNAKENQDGKVSTTSKVSQKISTTTSRPS